MTFTKLALFIFCIVGSASVFAHTKLQSSIPEGQSVLTDAPESINLVFSKAVSLIKLSVKGSDNNKVATKFAISKNKSSTFSIPFNSELLDDDYLVNWVIIGADGHKVKGDFSFTLKLGK